MTFKEFIQYVEGGFVTDEKAEEGKSKVKNPAVRGPLSVTPSGIAGGAGGAKSGGGAPMMGAPAPTAAPK